MSHGRAVTGISVTLPELSSGTILRLQVYLCACSRSEWTLFLIGATLKCS
jgi:hypothetical protein